MIQRETKILRQSSASSTPRQGSASAICQNCKNQFAIEPEDFSFYEKMQVPPPTWCPRCRFLRRLVFMNDRFLYKRLCDLCGTAIVTMYAPDKELTVYCNSCWWSDAWDGREYGQEYDSSRPFLEQLRELRQKTPHMARDVNEPTLLNSDYINYAATSKNCYLMYFADECENVLYSEILLHNTDCMDATILKKSELCYEVVNCGNSYRLFYSEDCDSCRNVYFSKDCIGCSDCFACVGLRNKRYYIWNTPYTREAYAQKLEGYKADSYRAVERLKEEARAFWRTYPHKFSHSLHNTNTTGDYVYGAKNGKNMFWVNEGVEDSRYCQLLTMPGVKDAYDYTSWGNHAQRIYEGMITGEGADTIKFSFNAWPDVRSIEYSWYTMSSSYMFGCANIRKKQYCILNMQYSETEFFALRKQIILDMDRVPYRDPHGRVYKYGEFFPPAFSLFGYNESWAFTLFPETKERALQSGFTWYDPKPPDRKPTMGAFDIPDSIRSVTDSILQEIIECEVCGAPFRIIIPELTLLRSFGLPVPHRCPNCRYKERMSRVNKPLLYKRRCQCAGTMSEAASGTSNRYRNAATHFHGADHCPNEFETSYSPNRPEIVYCESCYQNEVV